MAHPALCIDEYLRERLMPVEGAIPHIPGIEVFGNSIPARIDLCLATFRCWELAALTLLTSLTAGGEIAREKLLIPRRLSRPRLWHAICVCVGRKD